VITGICEVTLQARNLEALAGFYADMLGLDVLSRDEGGDRSIYFRDPEGNVAELWDFFELHTVETLAS
jgi:catechol-2,3-dioxygenase